MRGAVCWSRETDDAESAITYTEYSTVEMLTTRYGPAVIDANPGIGRTFLPQLGGRSPLEYRRDVW